MPCCVACRIILALSAKNGISKYFYFQHPLVVLGGEIRVNIAVNVVPFAKSGYKNLYFRLSEYDLMRYKTNKPEKLSPLVKR